MDPITIISTALTIGTSIHEVISLAQKIKSSLSKVSRNKEKLRELLEHILNILEELHRLYNDDDEALEKCSDLRRSLNLLKTDMHCVHERCQKLIPDRDPGTQLSQVKVKAKAWYKRDEIETEIAQLKEHVMSCYAKFTAFTAARIGNTSVRIEHAILVHGTETHARLDRLEILINRMLLDTEYGQKIVHDLDTRFSNAQYDVVEYQYLALQVSRIVRSLESLAATRAFRAEEPNKAHKIPFKRVYPEEMPGSIDVVFTTLSLLRQVQDHPDGLSIQDGAQDLDKILHATGWFRMRQEHRVVCVWITKLYSALASGNSYAFLPFLVHALDNLVRLHRVLEEYDLALVASERALSYMREIQGTHADLDFRLLYAQVLQMHGHALQLTKRSEDALPIMRECTSMYETLLAELPETLTENTEPGSEARKQRNTTLIDGLKSFLYLTECLSVLDRPSEAFHVARKSLNIFLRLPKSDQYITVALHYQAFKSIFSCLSSIYERHSLPLSLVEDTIYAYRDLAQSHPTFFSRHFLQALYVYACICNGTVVDGIAGLEDSDSGNPFSGPQSWESEDFTDLSERLRRLGHFEWAKSITRDAIYALHVQGDKYIRPYNLLGVQSLVRALFMSQVNEGVAAIQEASETVLSREMDDVAVIENFMVSIRDLALLVPIEEQTKLLVISDDVIEHHRSMMSKRKQGDDFLDPALPRILRTYSDILGYFPHRQEDAIRIAEESVHLCRQAKQDSKRNPLLLADALQDLAARYNIADRIDDAISTLQDSIANWRRVLEASPSTFGMTLSAALVDLSTYLSQAGRHSEAAAARAEAQFLRDRYAPPSPEVALFPVGGSSIVEETPSSDLFLSEVFTSTEDSISMLSTGSSSSTTRITEAVSESPLSGDAELLPLSDLAMQSGSNELSNVLPSVSEKQSSPVLNPSPQSALQGLGNEFKDHHSTPTPEPAVAAVPGANPSQNDVVNCGFGLVLLRRRFTSLMNLFMICCTVIVVVNFFRNQWGLNIHFSVSTQ